MKSSFSEKVGLYGKDHDVEADVIEGPLVCVSRNVVVQVLIELDIPMYHCS